MSHLRKHTYLEVPLKIDGSNRNIKGVTKYTTCGDVIKMVLKKLDNGKENSNLDSFGIFESSRGIERILPGKHRLSKIMRSWGSTGAEFEFVLRKVNPVVSLPKISEAKRRKLNQRARGLTGNASAPLLTRVSTDGRQTANKYNHTSKFAGLIHSQNARLNKYESVENNEFVKEIYFGTSDDSMDGFISHVDRSKMAGFLNVCGADTADEINCVSSLSKTEMSRNITGQSESSFMVHTKATTSSINVNNVKYAVRKTLKSKTLLTSNVHSASFEEDTSTRRATKHKLSNANTSISPVHSTPCLRTPKYVAKVTKHHEELACSITSQIELMSQKEGKDALLQKYFADYITYRSPRYRSRDSRYRERGDDAEEGDEVANVRKGDGSEHVTNFKPRRNHHCPVSFSDNVSDSGDSGQEEDVSNFDTAFIDDYIPASKYTSHVTKLVDYSISEDEHSVYSDPSQISACSDNPSNVSSVSDVVRNIFNENVDLDEDDEMASFMNTKLYDEFSDEGLSSMESDHDDEKEFIV